MLGGFPYLKPHFGVINRGFARYDFVQRKKMIYIYIYMYIYIEMYLVLIEFHELVSQQNCQCTGGSSQRGSGPLSVRCVSQKNYEALALAYKVCYMSPLDIFSKSTKIWANPATYRGNHFFKWQGTLVFVKQNVLRLGDIPFSTEPAHA